MKVFACFLLFFSLGSYGKSSNNTTSNEQCPYINEGDRHEYANLIMKLSDTPYKGKSHRKKGQRQGSGSE